MLNKELLMVCGGSLEPVLSIYISPAVKNLPSVAGTYSTGESFSVRHTGMTTFKFSEIKLTETITISYYEDVQLSTHNLIPETPPSPVGYERAPAVLLAYFRIADRTQSASISLS